MIHEVSFFEFVNFDDDSEAAQKYETMGDAINFVDSVSSHKFYESFSELLNFTDRIDYTAELAGDLTDTVTFTDEIYHKRGAMDEFIQFFDVMSAEINVMKDILTFSDVMSAERGSALSDTLTFDDLLTYDAILNVSPADILVLTDRFSGFSFNYHIPIITPPAPSNSVVFTSSYDTSLTITLPAPKFGDSRTTNFKRVNKKSRGQSSIISGEDNWFPTFLRKLEWDYLSEDQVTGMQNFMKKHVAIPVTVLSHYAETWKVIFVRPDVEFSQIGRENRSFTLDMQIVQ